jgi:hypothetical protein
MNQIGQIFAFFTDYWVIEILIIPIIVNRTKQNIK